MRHCTSMNFGAADHHQSSTAAHRQAVVSRKRRRRPRYQIESRSLVISSMPPNWHTDSTHSHLRSCWWLSLTTCITSLSTIAFVVPESASFPDNWIYVHDPNVKVGRVPKTRSLVALPREGQ